MTQFSVKTGAARALVNDGIQLAKELQGYADTIRNAAGNLNYKSANSSSVKARLKSAAGKIDSHRAGMSGMSSALSAILDDYDNVEKRILSDGSAKKQTAGDIFRQEFKENYGLGELLKGTGYIGTIYDIADGIKNGKSSADFVKAGRKIWNFIDEARDTYKNYKQIGNAVGTSTSMCWWFKNITGLKKVGRVSTAQNPFTRFAHNLTNKTSPFHEELKKNVGDYTGANGTGKAMASWAGVVMTGISKYKENKEEQAASKGEMSDERVIAETIVETTVDTVIDIGAKAVVGAAVSAVVPFALPGVVVAAASGLVVTGINAGVKALTGKTTTEWISDAVVDLGEKVSNAANNIASDIGNKVGKVARNVTNAIGSWFGKTVFA